MKLPAGIILLMLLGACSTKESKSTQEADTTSRGKELANDTANRNYQSPEVRNIEAQAKRINDLRITDSLVLEGEDFIEQSPDGGASITGYYFNNDLVKIHEWIGVSYGVFQRHYYFQNDTLIHLLDQEDYFFTDSAGIDHSRFGEGFIKAYFFKSHRLVGSLSSGQKRFESDHINPENKWLQDAVRLKTILKQKRMSN